MRRWQLFLGIEFALILWLGFQIITNPMALTTILFGVLFLFFRRALASNACVQCDIWWYPVGTGNLY